MIRESSDQATLNAKLERAGWLTCHTPNQGRRSPKEWAALTRMGAKRGWPDLQVYGGPRAPGVAIEMRRRGKKRQVADHRERIYSSLEACGWTVLREQDYSQAIAALIAMGYLDPCETDTYEVNP